MSTAALHMQLHEETLPDEYWADRDWAWDHYAEFVKQYPDEWIAMLHRKIVAHGENLEDVETIVKQETSQSRFPVIFVEGRIHVYAY